MTPVLSLVVVALVLALVALVSVGGIRREMRELEARLVLNIGNDLQNPAVVHALGTGKCIVLKADLSCESCVDAVERFAGREGDAESRAFLLLPESSAARAREIRGSSVEIVVSDELFKLVRTPWVPALLRISDDGRVVDAMPAARASDVDRFYQLQIVE